MIIPSHVRIAFASLRSTRIRTALTTLGIVIGVTSITLILALGEGAKQAISHQITKLDQGIVLVKPGRLDQQGIFSSYNPFSIKPATTLTERDTQTISSLPQSAATAPLMFISGSIKNQKQTIAEAPILATTTDLVNILKLKVISGQFLDASTNRDTVVLGETLAIQMLGTNQARGQEIIIKGRPHTVVGILQNTASPINVVGVDLDRTAFISLDAGKSFNQGIAQIQQILVAISPTAKVAESAAAIDASLLKNHANERDFTVLEGANAGQGANEFYNVIVAVTTAVATIALVVGGVGIMNVMLVSVTDRTREIGIRKALGATDSQILIQFLIEALVMTISGGFIGLILAYIIAFMISNLFAFQPALTWPIVTVALGMSFTTGIIFGLFPALRASKKDPITALRQYQ